MSDFLNLFNEQPQAQAQAQPQPVTPMPEIPEVEENTKPKKKTTTPTRENLAYIKQNIRTKSIKELAADTNLTPHQVSRLLNDERAFLRKGAIKDAEAKGVKAYGVKTKKMKSKDGQETERPVNDYTQPLTEYATKIERYIKENLSRPENTRVGSQGGPVADLIQQDVNDILSSMGL